VRRASRVPAHHERADVYEFAVTPSARTSSPKTDPASCASTPMAVNIRRPRSCGAPTPARPSGSGKATRLSSRRAASRNRATTTSSSIAPVLS
jgi:hypothetical protein